MPIAIASRGFRGLYAARFTRVASAAVARPIVAQTQRLPRLAMSTKSGVSSPLVQHTAWQRLCVSDLDRLYPLLTAYIQQPSLAESVTELVMDFSSSDYSWPNDYPPDEPREPSLGVAGDLVRKHVCSLGLGDRETKAMLHVLRLWTNRPEIPPKGQPGDLPSEPDYLRDEFAGLAAVVLLSLCKNISTLHMAQPLSGFNPMLEDYLLKTNYGLLQAPGLQNLKKVEVLPGWWWNLETTYGHLEFLRLFQYFHRLPAINAISIDSFQEYQSYYTSFIPRTGNMKTLKLEHVDMDDFLLGLLISIPKVLVNLKVSLGGKEHMDGGVPTIHPQSIGRALAQHKETVAALDLDLDLCVLESTCKGKVLDSTDGTDDGDSDIEEFGRDYYKMDQETRLLVQKTPIALESYGWTIGSLHDFTSLTHLSIGIYALLGPPNSLGERLARLPPFRLIDALPPNLESFCLYGYKKGENIDVDEHVNEFLINKEARFPSLKEVKGIEEEVPGVAQLFPEESYLERMSARLKGEEEETSNQWPTPEFPDEWKPVEQSSLR
ncbi:unnamed protein product [Clonostachys solani]|uniref:Uncharacterized protein n=1 Tax=Clonostachys solani TaxID=160281 RepID=A0A9N9ZNL5_9HYPO|nr:unnamed protein product [Clonostachys solani]